MEAWLFPPIPLIPAQILSSPIHSLCPEEALPWVSARLGLHLGAAGRAGCAKGSVLGMQELAGGDVFVLFSPVPPFPPQSPELLPGWAPSDRELTGLVAVQMSLLC